MMGLIGRRARQALAALAVVWALPATASASMATPCSTCEGCTAALATPGAAAELTDDLVHEGDGPCIVIRGEGARLDGLERDIRSLGGRETVGVSVEAGGVLVRNLHVMGADVGIRVAGVRGVTLFHHWIEAGAVGIAAAGTTDLRVTRTVLRGGRVGVAFGAGADGTCAPALPLSNRGAVLVGLHVEGAGTGVAACDAIPVVRGSTLVRNGAGLVLGSPAAGDGQGATGGAGPWDACACAPDIAGVSAGTALFYSSGCHGCQVHEAWLPELHAAGHDIVVRATGPENAVASQAFDAFMDRCAPQMTDVVGVPGCVPNYVCLANDQSYKVRDGEDGLRHEVQVGTKEQLAAFEQACRAAAERSLAGPGCVSHALVDNVICESTGADVSATPGARVAGVGNACARTVGWTEAGAEGCARPCPASIAAPALPAPRVREGADVPAGMIAQPVAPPPVAAPAPSQASVEPVAAPAASAVQAPEAPPAAAEAAPPPVAAGPAEAAGGPADGIALPAAATAGSSTRTWMVLGGGLLALLLVIGLIWYRWEDRT